MSLYDKGLKYRSWEIFVPLYDSSNILAKPLSREPLLTPIGGSINALVQRIRKPQRNREIYERSCHLQTPPPEGEPQVDVPFHIAFLIKVHT